MLPEIAEAVGGGSMKILVDGGIRNGIDIFKALALGADGVLIARPFVTAVYGGAEEGVRELVNRLGSQLKTLWLCAAHTVWLRSREIWCGTIEVSSDCGHMTVSERKTTLGITEKNITHSFYIVDK